MTKRLAMALVLIGTLSMTQPATAWTQPKGPCSESRYKITRDMPLSVRQDKSRAVIRCAFGRFAPGQADYAITIASRESGLDPFAHNTWSDARGLFQMLGRYWDGRVSAYLERPWFPNRWPSVSAFSARANALVASKMVARGGWSAWSTAG